MKHLFTKNILFNVITQYAPSPKIISNVSWLSFESILRSIIGLFVFAWMARYLGASDFGKIGYVLAITTLTSPLFSLGIDQIVVKKITESKEDVAQLLGTTLGLRIAGFFALFGVSALIMIFLESLSSPLVVFTGIVATGYLFRSLEVIDHYFVSQTQSKYSAIAKAGGLITVSLVRAGGILMQAPLLFFIVSYALEYFAAGIGYLIQYMRVCSIPLKTWKFDVQLSRNLLSESWPLIFASFAVVLYMKVDQLMIGAMISESALGVYTTAVKLSESWYFVPTAICASVFPKLVQSRQNPEDYHKNLRKLFFFAYWFSIIVALFVTFTSDFVINLLYGPEYQQASLILSIHIWSGIFVFMSVASFQYLVSENLTRISMYSTIIGGVVNVLLNLLFIPQFGVIAAAWTTLISYAVSVYSVLLFAPTRKLAMMMLRSISFK